jgi:four helix bundle suffix protein
MDRDALVPCHGGYRRLKSFRLAQLTYDVTVRFCDLYVNRFSRTRDQMVQAARSGVQNIAEGSQASGTSKKTELKLTNVARASLEELRLDYEDFLRQRGLDKWTPEHPALRRFRARRCGTLEEVRAWITDEHGETAKRKQSAPTGPGSVSVRARPCSSVSVRVPPPPTSQLAANAALSILNLCCHLLDRQVASLAAAFEREGGFTERLYRVRTRARR